MDGQKTAAELHHFRAAGGGLGLLAMMKRHIPPVDGCVIAAEGHFEIVVLLEADDAALDLDVEAGSGRTSNAGVAAGGETELSEERNLGRQGGIEVQDELSFVKAALGSGLIGGGE